MNTDARGIDSPEGGEPRSGSMPQAQEPGDAKRHAPKESIASRVAAQEGVPADVWAAFEAAKSAAVESGAWESYRAVEQAFEKLRDALLATRPTPAQAAPQAETPAARDVLAERRRQIESEGWTPEHDDEDHDNGGLARAAAAYTMAAAAFQTTHPGVARWLDEAVNRVWPWTPMWWKPGEPRRMLVKAGALILAEIERLDRAKEQDLC